MTSYLATPSYLKFVYGAFSGRRREKLDYILEPLQALLQLSLLGFSPVGSKLTIKDNLLYIQTPGVSQGIIRFFNDDSKEDLYYLFNVFRRFVVYYKHIYVETRHKQLYELLIELSKRGLDKLIMTYTNTERINVLHTLQMYKVILNKPDFVIPNPATDTKPTTANTGVSAASGTHSGQVDNISTNPANPTSTVSSIHDLDMLGLGNTGNIDNIFKNIVSIYSNEELNIIYNTLLILQRRADDDCQTYIDGLNMILQPTYGKIKQWITDNIAL